MVAEVDLGALPALISDERLAPYREQARGDLEAALSLYAWSAQMSAAAFEVIGHFEVILRNAMDQALREHFREEQIGIPWFLLDPPVDAVAGAAVATVRSRLRPQHRETRDQIVAHLGFGFWSGLLGVKYEQLWRDCLHRAFPRSNGTRKQVATTVEAIRKFRNRVAHHDSTLNLDLPFEIRRIFTAVDYIDGDAAGWLRSISRVDDVYRARPAQSPDTVVVAAGEAWGFYERHRAYCCQPNRWFRPVERMAFYCDRQIKPDIPHITARRDNVACTPQETARLLASADREDRKFGKVLQGCLDEGLGSMGALQVFLLTAPGDPRHRLLPQALDHHGRGKGSAFTQRQRYVSLHALEVASTTADLLPPQ